MSIPLTSTQILKRAYLILFFSVFALLYAGFTIFGCLGMSLEEEDERAGSKVARIVCEDNHYRYLLPLIISSGAYYIIANWVGWEYFRYA